MSFPLPEPLLVQRAAPNSLKCKSLIACPGFETKIWRFERLAAHLTDWLPEFVFRPDDLPDEILTTSAVRKLLERAVEHLYKEDTSTTRGELGELLLHVCCRQFCSTFPAVSKLFYKTSSNDVIKGFDIAHIRSVSDDEIELWLGEAKFFQDGADAVRKAVGSVNTHLSNDFLRSEKIMLGGKISPSTPGYKHIQWIFDQDTSLDEIFDRIVIPILIAYDSEACKSYQSEANYDSALVGELTRLDALLEGKIRSGVDIVLFYVPMNNKTELQSSFNKKLAGYRA
jgi:HamA